MANVTVYNIEGKEVGTIELNDAIRSLGYTKVPVKLHHDVTATLNVHVKEQ